MKHQSRSSSPGVVTAPPRQSTFGAWRFEIPGQPPSWNASYKIVVRYRQTATGGSVPFRTLAKKEPVLEYQATARLIVRSRMPSRWKPRTEQVRILYWLYLSHDMDCDNIMKAIHDVIEAATGVNDMRFLPCVLEKKIVPKGREKVVVEVRDDLDSLSVGPPT